MAEACTEQIIRDATSQYILLKESEIEYKSDQGYMVTLFFMIYIDTYKSTFRIIIIMHRKDWLHISLQVLIGIISFNVLIKRRKTFA